MKSTGPTAHNVADEGLNEEGSVDSVSTVIVVLTHEVVLQEPLARA